MQRLPGVAVGITQLRQQHLFGRVPRNVPGQPQPTEHLALTIDQRQPEHLRRRQALPFSPQRLAEDIGGNDPRLLQLFAFEQLSHRLLDERYKG
ncbi:hypothetical protein D3C87_1307940 [compost metagenome]